MREFEGSGSRGFVYGFEESYGYLADTFVRDKDRVIAAVMALLLVKYAIGVHSSVFSFLEFLYWKYGMYMEYGKSFTLRGADGAKRIRRLMKTLRENPPDEIMGSRVTQIKDFLSQKQMFLNGKRHER